MMLTLLGYTVVQAASGREAIEAVRISTEPFVAILMDVSMQDMNGFEATKEIRALEKTKGYCNTIIAVTAHALESDRKRCLDVGMNDYMSKPLHPDMLAYKLNVLVKATQCPEENSAQF